MRPVTSLYSPASRPDRLPKALASGADEVIVDLEDAVLAPKKDEARRHAVAFLDTMAGLESRPALQVRVNHPRGAYGPADLRAVGMHSALTGPDPVGVRIPKVDGPDDVELAIELLGVTTPSPLYCLLESARGVENAAAIAAHPAVSGIGLGEADLRAELGLRTEEAFTWVRSRIVVAARAAGLPAPQMAVYVNLTDDAGLAASCARGRELGMFGRTALHPRQLPVIAAAFTPTAAEAERAREVVAAAEGAAADGSGALALPDGRFIDAPLVDAARQVLALTERLGVRSD
ncbi:MAG: CoA ester lyase [Streptosporangiales bacterium]|nr:CoA ester lyase [Streptosporangiales bacterium]